MRRQHQLAQAAALAAGLSSRSSATSSTSLQSLQYAQSTSSSRASALASSSRVTIADWERWERRLLGGGSSRKATTSKRLQSLLPSRSSLSEPSTKLVRHASTSASSGAPRLARSPLRKNGSRRHSSALAARLEPGEVEHHHGHHEHQPVFSSHPNPWMKSRRMAELPCFEPSSLPLTKHRSDVRQVIKKTRPTPPEFSSHTEEQRISMESRSRLPQNQSVISPDLPGEVVRLGEGDILGEQRSTKTESTDHAGLARAVIRGNATLSASASCELTESLIAHNELPVAAELVRFQVQGLQEERAKVDAARERGVTEFDEATLQATSIKASGLGNNLQLLRSEMERIFGAKRQGTATSEEMKAYRKALCTLADLLRDGFLPLSQDCHTGWLLASLNRQFKSGKLAHLREHIRSFAEVHVRAELPGPALKSRAFTTLLDMVLQQLQDVQLAIRLLDVYVPARVTADSTMRNVIFHYAGQKHERSITLGALQQLVEAAPSEPYPQTTAHLFERHFTEALDADDPYKVAMLLRWAAHEHPWPANQVGRQRIATLKATLCRLWPQVWDAPGKSTSLSIAATSHLLVAPKCSSNVHVLTAAINLTGKLAMRKLSKAIWRLLTRECMGEPTILKERKEASTQRKVIPVEAATSLMQTLADEAIVERKKEASEAQEADKRSAPLTEALAAHKMLSEHWDESRLLPDAKYFHALFSVAVKTLRGQEPVAVLAHHREGLQAALELVAKYRLPVEAGQKAMLAKITA